MTSLSEEMLSLNTRIDSLRSMPLSKNVTIIIVVDHR